MVVTRARRCFEAMFCLLPLVLAAQGRASSPFPPEVSAAPGAGPTEASAAADPRRMLVAVDVQPAGAYTEWETAAIGKSLVLALGEASKDFWIVELGNAAFPAALDKRIETAKTLDADCFLWVSITGDRQAPAVVLQSYDLSFKDVVIDQALPAQEMSTKNAARIDWNPLVALVMQKFKAVDGTGVRRLEARSARLHVRALPGTRISGLPGGPLTVSANGGASVESPAPASYTLRADHGGYYPSTRKVYVDRDRELAITLDPASRWGMELTFFNAFFPGLEASWYFVPGYAFVKAGLTAFLFGLQLGPDSVFFSFPVASIDLEAGMYFNPEDSAIRLYGGAGAFLRVSQSPDGTRLQMENLSPFGFELSLGGELAFSQKSRFFAEYAPQAFLSSYPSLFHAALRTGTSQSGSGSALPGWVSTRWGALSLLNLRFGFRWYL